MKSFPFILFMIVILMIDNATVYANPNDIPQPLEEFFPEIGYKTVEAALKDFEHHFKQEVKLPLRVPPISFTHHFGRFSDLDGEMNDNFEVTMINDHSPQNHFKITVRPVKYKIEFSSERYASKIYKLNNGIDAKYMEEIPQMGINLFVFEKDKWQYMFSIDKRVSDKVTAEVLVQIANSIDY